MRVSDKLLAALATIESSNNPKAVGDNGKAIGVYQIHRVYWEDASQFDKTLKSGRYEDCVDPTYAARVVRAYMARYAPVGASDEQLARIHNGGPKGYQRGSTKGYWAKVVKELARRSSQQLNS